MIMIVIIIIIILNIIIMIIITRIIQLTIILLLIIIQLISNIFIFIIIIIIIIIIMRMMMMIIQVYIRGDEKSPIIMGQLGGRCVPEQSRWEIRTSKLTNTNKHLNITRQTDTIDNNKGLPGDRGPEAHPLHPGCESMFCRTSAPQEIVKAPAPDGADEPGEPQQGIVWYSMV